MLLVPSAGAVAKSCKLHEPQRKSLALCPVDSLPVSGPPGVIYRLQDHCKMKLARHTIP